MISTHSFRCGESHTYLDITLRRLQAWMADFTQEEMKTLRTPSSHRILALGGFPFPDLADLWFDLMQVPLYHGRVFPPTPQLPPDSDIIWINLYQQVKFGPWWLGKSRFIAKSSTDPYSHQALLIDRYILKLYIHICCKSVDALVKKT